MFREDKLKHHLLKGCTPHSSGDLDQSIDSRDSRDSETHEEIDDDEEEHLKEDQEEIDDDEDQALARRTQTSTEHGLITISQYRCGFNF